MTARPRWFATVAVAATLTLPLAGCGDDGDDKTTSSEPTTQPTADGSASDTTATSGSETETVEPTKVEVGLADYSFEIPDTLTAGPTAFVATNTGAEEHHMTLVKLKDGQTMDDVVAVLAGDVAKGIEENELVPGPQAVAPGGTQSMIVDLEEGKYVALCAIPGPEGLPHAAMGMMKELTVEPADAPVEGSAVPADPTVVLKDYAFELPADFDGQGTFRVENVGDKPHEIAFYKLADGMTLEQFKELVSSETPPAEAPPIAPSGGVTAISPGQVGGMVLDLEPGTYAALCFLPGTDGQTHFQHGMIQEVVIE